MRSYYLYFHTNFFPPIEHIYLSVGGSRSQFSVFKFRTREFSVSLSGRFLYGLTRGNVLRKERTNN